MEGVLRHKVRLLPHNEAWEKEYEIVKEEILAAWGDIVIDIQHIGSTSIRGIYAKPILDVAVVVKSFEEMKPEALVYLGYEYKGPDLPDEGRHLFILRDERDYSLRHIHCYEPDNGDFLDCVDFRDYMNTHPEEAKAYSDLKLELEKQHAEDRVSYGNGKHEFIQNIYLKLGELRYL